MQTEQPSRWSPLADWFAGPGPAHADDVDAADAPEATQTSARAGEAHAPEAPQTTQCPPEPGEADAPKPRQTTQTSWYGWQTLLADAGVIALWSAAYSAPRLEQSSSSPQSYDVGTNLLVASGVAVYFLGGPGHRLGARPRPQGARAAWG